MQRAVEGKSNSFRGKESSTFTDNIEKDIDFLDYFALNSKFKGKFKKWNLDIDSELKL